MKSKVTRGFQRFVRWLFGSPFRNLPPGFDEPVPEMEIFETQVEELQQHERGNLPTAGGSTPHHRSDTIHSKK